MPVQCETLVVHCMDYRLQSHINRWLEQTLPPQGYDRVALAGGVYDLYHVIRQVDFAERLHGIRRVILINHEDCGMYGPAGTDERHEQDLKNAKEKIRRLFHEIEVDTYFLHLNGVFERH